MVACISLADKIWSKICHFLTECHTWIFLLAWKKHGYIYLFFISKLLSISTLWLILIIFVMLLISALLRVFIRKLATFLYIFHSLSDRQSNIKVLFFYKTHYNLNLSVSGIEIIFLYMIQTRVSLFKAFQKSGRYYFKLPVFYLQSFYESPKFDAWCTCLLTCH